ncbi:MAG: S41 family peptidase [Planctomycetota bacterium]|nr:MAG: S41 family peptidase [Planctomycetota bacterium]
MIEGKVMPMSPWICKIRSLLFHALAALLVAALLVTARASAEDLSGVDLSRYANAEEAKQAGEQLESSRQWVEAITLYEASLEAWQNDEGLKYALRRTRIHFGVDRRYSDRSFENQLLSKGRAAALDLYEDILSRVQNEYVDTVSPGRFVAHGTESLYMALKNEKFLGRNVQPGRDAAVERVRSVLIKDFWNRPLETRMDARSAITTVCELCDRELGISGTAVVMEYIFGGCNALDEYSNFLTPDRYNDLFGSIQGEMVGIGIEMKGVKGRGMHLVNVLLDSPAEQGGLQPDDYIVAIDGQDCRDFSTDDAARLLRGSGGSRLELTFESPGGTQKSGTFTRRRVQIRSITRTVMLDETRGIGYIRMEGFQNNTAEELDEALRTLERKGMRALIWDLRGNPGGLLETAAAVIERFIDRGVLVSTEGRAPEQSQIFQAHGNNVRHYPLTLLVDENSASASEIVAGAIKDHRRGTIVGRKTYGKWSVQSIIHLPGETGLKLTTAKFFSPAHGNYAGKGLVPDVVVPSPEDTQVTFFRGRTSDEISADADVAAAIEELQTRLTRK